MEQSRNTTITVFRINQARATGPQPKKTMKFLIDTDQKSKELIAIMNHDEAILIHGILVEYCDKNKRKKKAEKLLNDFDKKLEVY